jgi:RNA polymerase sigma-70 factor (ECF subfamily)
MLDMTRPDISAPIGDASLVERMAVGDRDALASLMDELGGPAYSLALRIARDPSLAEEAVQDAFIEMWRHAASYDQHTASVLTWALGYVRHKAIDRVRHEQRRRPRTADGSTAAVVDAQDAGLVDRDSGSDPIAAAWAAAQSGEITRALADLSPDQRHVLELAYFGGLSQSEVAEQIGVPIGTVKTRTHRALALLRDILMARGLEGDES